MSSPARLSQKAPRPLRTPETTSSRYLSAHFVISSMDLPNRTIGRQPSMNGSPDCSIVRIGPATHLCDAPPESFVGSTCVCDRYVPNIRLTRKFYCLCATFHPCLTRIGILSKSKARRSSSLHGQSSSAPNTHGPVPSRKNPSVTPTHLQNFIWQTQCTHDPGPCSCANRSNFVPRIGPSQPPTLSRRAQSPPDPRLPRVHRSSAFSLPFSAYPFPQSSYGPVCSLNSGSIKTSPWGIRGPLRFTCVSVSDNAPRDGSRAA